MQKFRKSLLFLVFISLLTIALVACNAEEEAGNGEVSEEAPSADNGESEEANETYDGQTLRVQMIGGFDQEDSTDPITGETVKGVNVLKDEFEKRFPGTTVEFTIIPWKGHTEKTQAMFTSGEADVYQTPGLSVFVPQDFLEPLQPFIDEDDDFDLDIFIDNQVEGWKVKGPDSDELEIYGLPYLGDTRLIVYDKKIFDQWGVEYLSEFPTMDEIAEKAEKMTGTNPETGEQNYGVWFQGDRQSGTLLVNTAEAQNGSWGEGLSWDEVEFNFNSPEMENGLNWLLDLQEFAPEGLVSNQGSEKWLTEENDIGIMLFQAPGDTIKQVYTQGFEDRIGISQEFTNDEGVGGLFAGSPISIAKSSENKELAWEWVKFATSDFVQKYIFEEAGIMPTVKSATEWESIQEKELVQPILKAMSIRETPRYPWDSAQPQFILSSEVEAVLTGERNVKEALDKAQKESTEWAENQ